VNTAIDQRKKVLVLCTGNSCRSHLAEALINHRLGETWQAYSAGTEPAGYVHPMALQVLREIGIEHRGESKSVDVFRNLEPDLVITVCSDAEQNCPVWLGIGERVHLGFTDPAKAQGTEEEIRQVFREIRNEIDDLVLDYIKRLTHTPGNIALG